MRQGATRIRRCAAVGLLLALCLGGTALAAPTVMLAEAEPSGGGAIGDAPEKLSARLMEAERLASSGDYVMAETVLAEAAEIAAASGSQSLDAVDRVRARIEFRRGNYNAARERHRAVLQRASDRRDSASVAQAEVDIASLDRRQGDLGAALAGFERALNLYRKLEDRDGMASVLTHIGLVRLNQGVYAASLEALNESLALQRSGAKAELERTYHYLGLLYAGLREYETSRTYLDRGLTEARRLADAGREAPLLGSIARVANFQGKHSEALTWSIEAERLAERMDSPPGRVYAGLERGRALLGLGKVEEAREVLERGEKIAAGIAQLGTLADYRGQLAEVAMREGRDEDALRLWEQALPAYQSGDDQPQLYSVYRALIPLLQRQGQTERALEIALRSLDVQEQISGLDMNRRLAVVESESRAREAQREIEILKRDNEIQGLRLSEQATQRWAAAAVIVGLVVIVALLAMRYRESRRMGRQLAESNQALLASQEALRQAHAELEHRAEQLASAASTDPLTGVGNRRDFMQRFESHWHDARRRGSELSLVLIDVDHFKKINDSLGHAVGDAVLCALAATLQATVRAGTLLARWGGEEFAILVPGADAATASGLAERLRLAVAAIRREDLPAITISIGVASIGGRALGRPDCLFEEADAALYEAKAGGRNQVRLSRSLPPGAIVH